MGLIEIIFLIHAACSAKHCDWYFGTEARVEVCASEITDRAFPGMKHLEVRLSQEDPRVIMRAVFKECPEI